VSARRIAKSEDGGSDLNIKHPASNIQHPASNIKHPASSIQHQTSSIQHPASIMPQVPLSSRPVQGIPKAETTQRQPNGTP